MLEAELLRADASPMQYKKLAIPGWPDIDPVTVVMALNDAAAEHGMELPQATVDKVHAVQTALLNPIAYADAYTFEKTAEALNGLEPQFDTFPVILAPARIALAVQTLHRLRPDEEWGVIVKRYCREMLREQGQIVLPPSMDPVKFDDPEGPAEIELTAEQRKIQEERITDIEDYVKKYLGGA